MSNDCFVLYNICVYVFTDLEMIRAETIETAKEQLWLFFQRNFDSKDTFLNRLVAVTPETWENSRGKVR